MKAIYIIYIYMANYIKIPSNHTFNTITEITASLTGDEHAAHMNFGYNTVTSADTSHVARLPVPTRIGNIVYFNVTSNGFELRVTEGIGILSINGTEVTNGDGQDTNEMNVAANSFCYCVSTSLTNWDVFIMSSEKKAPDAI
jgi:hypothetical protein